MADQKTTALTETTTLVTTDLFYVVKDVATVPVSRKMTLQSVANMLTSIFSGTYFLSDGWSTPSGETWTYASASSFTVPNDMTTRYSVGTKLKMTNVSTKYFYVVASSYAAPNTTVTITGGTDYTLANAAITNPYYSYVANPVSFPIWFTYAPTLTGWSTEPPSARYTFRMVGNFLTVFVRQAGASVSNTTGVTITAPATSANVTEGYWGTCIWDAADNGTYLTSPGRAWIGPNSANIACYKNTYNGAWTNSGAKLVSFTLEYQV